MKNNYERLLAFMQNSPQTERDYIEYQLRDHVEHNALLTTDFVNWLVNDQMKFYYNGIDFARKTGLITFEEESKLRDELHTLHRVVKKHAYEVYYDERRKKRQEHSRRHSICVECYVKLKDKDIDLDSH